MLSSVKDMSTGVLAHEGHERERRGRQDDGDGGNRARHVAERIAHLVRTQLEGARDERHAPASRLSTSTRNAATAGIKKHEPDGGAPC